MGGALTENIIMIHWVVKHLVCLIWLNIHSILLNAYLT